MIHDNLYQQQYKFHTPGFIALVENEEIKFKRIRHKISLPNWLRNPTNYFWHFKQNPQLINVHKKLVNIKVEHLKLEMKTLEETNHLATNLERINEKFGKSKHRSFLARVAQAIVNFIKRYVFFQKVTERYHFDQKPIEDLIRAIREFKKPLRSLHTSHVQTPNITFEKPYTLLEVQARDDLILLDNFQVWRADNFPSTWRKGEQVIFSQYKTLQGSGEDAVDQEWYTVENQRTHEQREFQLVRTDEKKLTKETDRFINSSIHSVDGINRSITLADGFKYHLPDSIQEQGRLSTVTWHVNDSVRVDTVEKIIYNRMHYPKSLHYHE